MTSANVLIIALSEVIKADHGFNVESRAIRDLLEVMSEYDAATRRSFLQFITGSPKLPIGGSSLSSLVSCLRGSPLHRFPWPQPAVHCRSEAT